MGLFNKVLGRLVSRSLKEGKVEEEMTGLEPLLKRSGPIPKAKLAQISKFIEKYGVDDVANAIEIGIKRQEGGITFKLEITRDDIKNDPQFVVNAIQIAQAIKQMSEPQSLIPKEPAPKKIQEIEALMELGKKFGIASPAK